jgi:hypothetical protein
MWGFSEQILLALKQDPELARLAARYPQILFMGCISHVQTSLKQARIRDIRSHKTGFTGTGDFHSKYLCIVRRGAAKRNYVSFR